MSSPDLTRELRVALKGQFPKFAPESYALSFALRTFLFHIGILFLISYCAASASIALLVPIWVVSAVIIYRYQFILHEASHHVLCKDRKLNDLIGHIAGAAVGYNFEEYRYNHRIHHGYVGTSSDTEINNFIREKEFFGTPRSQMIRKLSASFFGLDALRIIFNKHQTKLKKAQKKNHLIFICISGIIQLFCLSLFTSQTTLLLAIIIFGTSVTCGTFFINRLRAISEHEIDENLKDFEYSKSHIASKFTAFLAPLNFNYHYEHHVLPDISSYNYPAVNLAIKKYTRTDTWCRTSFARTLMTYWRNNNAV